MESRPVARTEFAEHAECLGLRTDQIIESRPHPDKPGRLIVIFEDYGKWGAEIERDDDGVLREVHRKRIRP